MPHTAVPIAALGPVSVATMLFHESGLTHVTAIVKGTFSFDQDEPMGVTTPEPIVLREVHRMNNATRSITATSDLVPGLPGVDILVLGHAYAPGGSATRATLRLVVGRGNEPLLEKTIFAVGDRKGQEIKPFRSIPLVYEKAHGGPGFRDNPLGTGALEGDPPPNLVDPRGAHLAAGFAPISRSWPARLSMLPRAQRAGLDGPVMEIPQGFDWRYFHAAPPDQRMAQLAGDEWIVLENMHPHHPVLRLELPGARAMVQISGPGSAPRAVPLRADTLRIDTDAERCTIVWRHSFAVSEAELSRIHLVAAMALPDLPIEWPEAGRIQLAPVARTSPEEAPKRLGNSGTVILEDRPGKPPAGNMTLEISDEDIEAVDTGGDHADLASTMPFVTPSHPGRTRT